MRRARVFLAGTLVLLFLGLSFNAYACLVPLYGAATATMGSDCSSPEEQSARQFCDAFKTLGVQSAEEPHTTLAFQVVCAEDTVWLSFLFSLTARGSHLYDHPADDSPQDLLVKTTVLRL